MNDAVQARNAVTADGPEVVVDRPQRSRWAGAVAGIDASSDRGRESLSVGVGVMALTVVALLTLVIFRLRSLPIAGEGSIGQYAALSSAFVAIAAFVVGRWMIPRPHGTPRVLHALDVTVLAFAHAVIALLTWTLVAEIFERAFVDAVVFGLPSVIVAGTMAAITACLVFYSATHLHLTLMAVVLTAFFVEGLFASMLAASDPHWWKDDFSALGMPDDASAVAFNLTLIVSGLIITTLARNVPLRIPTTHEHGVVRVRRSLVLAGISLVLVGAFPADTFYWLHTGFALGVAVIFGLLVSLLPRWIPTMPAAFVAFGWLILAVLIVLFVLLAIGYYTLTAVEFVAGILVFAWIVQFSRSAAALQRTYRVDAA